MFASNGANLICTFIFPINLNRSVVGYFLNRIAWRFFRCTKRARFPLRRVACRRRRIVTRSLRRGGVDLSVVCVLTVLFCEAIGFFGRVVA